MSQKVLESAHGPQCAVYSSDLSSLGASIQQNGPTAPKSERQPPRITAMVGEGDGPPKQAH